MIQIPKVTVQSHQLIEATPQEKRLFMLKIVLAVMLLVMPFGLSACDKAYMATMEKMGYAKRDILSSRVKSARDAQEDAKKEIQSTLEQFGQVVSYDGGDLEANY